MPLHLIKKGKGKVSCTSAMNWGSTNQITLAIRFTSSLRTTLSARMGVINADPKPGQFCGIMRLQGTERE
jgi:hypothetical protein